MNYDNIKTFIELSKWFHRRSQHYILGDWYEYSKKFRFIEDYKLRFRFVTGYPKAYIRFMYLSRSEYLNGDK